MLRPSSRCVSTAASIPPAHPPARLASIPHEPTAYTALYYGNYSVAFADVILAFCRCLHDSHASLPPLEIQTERRACFSHPVSTIIHVPLLVACPAARAELTGLVGPVFLFVDKFGRSDGDFCEMSLDVATLMGGNGSLSFSTLGMPAAAQGSESEPRFGPSGPGRSGAADPTSDLSDSGGEDELLLREVSRDKPTLPSPCTTLRAADKYVLPTLRVD